MGNVNAYAQEAAGQDWGDYGPGVKVTKRVGGDTSKIVSPNHRYVEVSYKGKLAGGLPASGVGHLDLNLVNQTFAQLQKGDVSKANTSGIDTKQVEDNKTDHRAHIIANGPSMHKNREAGLFGRPFAPLGTAVLKCFERAIAGGYGEDGQPAPMAVGEALNMKCTKDVFQIDAGKFPYDMMAPPARGLWDKRHTTSGVAKFEIKLLDVMENPPWVDKGLFVPSQDEWVRRGNSIESYPQRKGEDGRRSISGQGHDGDGTFGVSPLGHKTVHKDTPLSA